MFDNSVIQPPVLDKPHIVLIDRYWRVSKLKKPYRQRERFKLAHDFVTRLNRDLHY